MFRSFFVKEQQYDHLPENIDPNKSRKVRRAPLQKIDNSVPVKIVIPPKQKPNYDEEEEALDELSEIEINVSNANAENHTEEEEEAEFNHVETQIGCVGNVQDVVQYENIIYRQMRNREKQFPCCMVEPEITAEDRGRLFDWIDRIHYKSQLSTSAFYRAVGIFDRALNLTVITRDTMKLFGVAALIIASKMEDTIPLQMNVLLMCIKDRFTPEEIKKKEIQLSGIINFDFAFPTPLFFLTYYLRICSMNQERMLFARYVMESSITSPDFLDVRPSGIAATAVILTRCVYDSIEDCWPETLVGYTQYSLEELVPHVKNAYSILTQEDRPECKFIRLKYGSEPFCYVSSKEIPEEIQQLFCE